MLAAVLVYLSDGHLAQARHCTRCAMRQITVTDLRILVGEMQKGFKETGCNWTIVRFLGSENG